MGVTSVRLSAEVEVPLETDQTIRSQQKIILLIRQLKSSWFGRQWRVLVGKTH